WAPIPENPQKCPRLIVTGAHDQSESLPTIKRNGCPRCPGIRKLAGVMAHEKVKNGVFITTSSFTLDATVFAVANGIVLLDGKEFLNAIKTLPVSDQEHLLAFATSGDYTTPTCAKCGVKMVLKKGYSEFWGCPNYPRCRETIRIRGAGRK
ncbi:MAG: restriction endonuclease, partial [Acidithiobacillus ferrivorans]